MPDPVHIFWDSSNIFIEAKRAAVRREGAYAQAALRIPFDALYKLASAGRDVVRAFCVGSIPRELAGVWGSRRLP